MSAGVVSGDCSSPPRSLSGACGTPNTCSGSSSPLTSPQCAQGMGQAISSMQAGVQCDVARQDAAARVHYEDARAKLAMLHEACKGTVNCTRALTILNVRACR
jgi:hypothetical protein